MPPSDRRGPRAPTSTGYAIPYEVTSPEHSSHTSQMRAAQSPGVTVSRDGASSASAAQRTPLAVGGIEFAAVPESEFAGANAGSVAILEIWTRNRIYHVDAEMVCVAVLERATMKNEPGHSLIGARLTGGERRSETSDEIEIYAPLPMPGTDAVFRTERRRHRHYGHTSTVERVVMRVRTLRAGAFDHATPWAAIHHAFKPR